MVGYPQNLVTYRVCGGIAEVREWRLNLKGEGGRWASGRRRRSGR